MMMPYTDDEIRRQLRLGEDSGWEFKSVEFHGDQPVRSNRDVWADEIAAFANARGGVLLLGVADTGEVSGMSRGCLDSVERLVTEICRDSVKPAIRAERTAGVDERHSCSCDPGRDASTTAPAAASCGWVVRNSR